MLVAVEDAVLVVVAEVEVAVEGVGMGIVFPEGVIMMTVDKVVMEEIDKVKVVG